MATYPNLLKENLTEFLRGLKEPDISIRKSALDNLFMLATEETSAEIINELLDHIQEANDFGLMEEMVLKVAILAERFAVNLSWYIDVIIKLIEYAGDYTSEDLWFRVAQMVTGFATEEEDSNEENLKKYAALRIVDIMRKSTLHETLIKIGAYVLSEFGYLIAEEPGKGYQEQFDLINKKMHSSSTSTQAVILTSLMKMTKGASPQTNQQIKSVFETCQNHWDIELQ